MSDAIKFIQQKGLDAAKELVNFGTGFVSVEDGLSFHTDQLISLIQSHEIINRFGGLDNAKKVAGLKGGYLGCKFDDAADLKLHIADVEACQGAAQ
ncbi:hypothetical protein [Acinetobacter radioresistens]|uniref:hypothetical protein n=1 Tax=Acinetobacter radioresistens TaxID=40216 RepID=UPI0009468459|nr:hypothetical protein [Acinetobacter radioresistens]